MTKAEPHLKLRYVRETGLHTVNSEMYVTVLFAPVEGTGHDVTMSVTAEVAEGLEPDVEYALVKA